MSRLIPLFFAFFLLAGSGMLSAAPSLDLSAAQQRALGIETQPAGSIAAASSRLPARVVVPPAQMRVLAAPVAGRMEMLAVVPGEAVRRGQVIAKLSSPQALELQRDVQQSAAQAALWRQNLQRDEQLFAEGLIAESRLRETRAAASQAFAQHDERRHSLELAGGDRGKPGEPLALVAPIDGIVLEQGVQLGQRVEAATPIYQIARLSPLWLDIQVPLPLAATLKVGMPLKVVAPPVSGKIVAVGRSVDPLSNGVLVRGEIAAGSELLTTGQMLEVEFDSQASHGIPIPAAAVIRHEGAVLVFVLGDAPGRFTARPVRIVSQGGGTVRVDGLQPDERVVVKGTSGLKALLGETGGM
ncbi:efflux RND transporter periplasmic adaptor subunit [Azonexus sp.]|jgi:RND family efflux transporter MFP subunit|uniref:efflux RND transporter periplasmic adaptor subunit n=1 Tax=Azonexus sp. TaxID=1872668 RepID=UPI00283821F2|nr:efflux RND transporter periplasmic adaptor subunit [Azonexus sp.]MDR1994278.1 efflux RND transporter periplasmic adaptor subunit [Azonexus sp.]